MYALMRHPMKMHDGTLIHLIVMPHPSSGGPFDPLGLASNPDKAPGLKEAEIKHGRLAMVAFLGEFNFNPQHF